MKFWWLVDSARLAAERRSIERAAAGEWFRFTRWTLHHGLVCVEGAIVAHENTYPIRLIYPDQFPLVPAWVEPAEKAQWSRHQYIGGSLCLELRPDNWDPTATGADVLESAFNLFHTEDPLGEGGATAPSDHRVGEVQVYGDLHLPALIGAGCLDRLKRGERNDVRALRWHHVDDTLPLHVHDAEDLAALNRPPEPNQEAGLTTVPLYISAKEAPDAAKDRTALLEAGEWEPEEALAIELTRGAEVLFLGGPAPSIFCLVAEKTHRRELYVLPDEDGLRTAARSRRDDKSVSIVGAGSVGSKIAESLVRSGVRCLELADGDVMLPGNLERHVLDWRDVGGRKVHALKKRLLNISPGTKVDITPSNLNWQRSAVTHAWQVDDIAEGKVIVDATGDPATSLFLGAIAHANNRPFVSVEVFEGGIGGLVAAVIPERDPPFSEGRATFLNWCHEQDQPPPAAGPRNYEALTQDGTPMAADDAAVSIIAAHAARIILDILDGNPPRPEAAWLLLGLQQAWLFEGHGHTIRLSVGLKVEAPGSQDDEEGKKFALELLNEAGSAD
jgi:molybdopterin/thiamine biosynthesis adenylyltransferase